MQHYYIAIFWQNIVKIIMPSTAIHEKPHAYCSQASPCEASSSLDFHHTNHRSVSLPALTIPSFHIANQRPKNLKKAMVTLPSATNESTSYKTNKAANFETSGSKGPLAALRNCPLGTPRSQRVKEFFAEMGRGVQYS